MEIPTDLSQRMLLKLSLVVTASPSNLAHLPEQDRHTDKPSNAMPGGNPSPAGLVEMPRRYNYR
jgi:hypothetical protein